MKLITAILLGTVLIVSAIGGVRFYDRHYLTPKVKELVAALVLSATTTEARNYLYSAHQAIATTRDRELVEKAQMYVTYRTNADESYGLSDQMSKESIKTLSIEIHEQAHDEMKEALRESGLAEHLREEILEEIHQSR